MIRRNGPLLSGLVVAILLLAGCASVKWFPPVYVPPPINYQLTITKAGTGVGTVTGPPPLSCGTTCTASYAQGASIALTAVPSGNSTFGGWAGACTGTGACTVAMTSAKTVTATFSLAGDVIAPPDPGPPTIGTITQTSTTVTFPITWTVSIDQPSNTPVPKYGWSAGFNTPLTPGDSAASQSGTVTSASLSLIMPYYSTNQATTGYVCVYAIDAANNVSGNSCNQLNIPAPPTATGIINVAWVNPITNTDGSAIPGSGTLALATTKVYYGTTSTPCPGGTFITSPSPTTSTQLTGLVIGQTYYVAVTAVNNAGTESACSGTSSLAAHAAGGGGGGLPSGLAVDMATDAGAVNYAYQGFHLSFNATQPDDTTYVLPLKMNFNQNASNNNIYVRVTRQPGSRFETQLYAAWGSFNGAGMPGNPPGCVNTSSTTCGVDWTNWTTWVNSFCGQASSQGLNQTNVNLEAWNEPDNNQFWVASDAQFNEAWRRAYVIIKGSSCAPNIRMTGPGFAAFDQTRLQTFLSFAKANNVFPDIINWHEITQPNACSPGSPTGGACNTAIPTVNYIGQYTFASRVTAIRNYISGTLGLAVPPIEIDESLGWPNSPQGGDPHLMPGGFVLSAANAYRNGIQNMAVTTWTEAISGVDEGGVAMLNGAITPDLAHKRAMWWARKAYADMTGRYRPVQADSNFDGMAAWDPSAGAKGTIRVILGNFGGGATTTLQLANMGSITTSTTASVTIQKIPNTGESTLDTLPAPTTATLSISSGVLNIAISGAAQWEAYSITVTPQ